MEARVATDFDLPAGVHALHLLVDPTNERAVLLYERTGFEKSHRVMMTKRLV
jgi:ribosomal protein S18 acetylase RimI-like enzyme